MRRTRPAGVEREGMGWVVKSWRRDALAALAGEQAQALLRAAERDARRLRRSAARETDDARAALTALEAVGIAELERVRAERRRRAAPGARWRPAGLATQADRPRVPGRVDPLLARHADPPVPRRADPPGPTPAMRPVTRRRASLRDSPVVELFRST